MMERLSAGDFNVGPSKPFAGDFAGIERSMNQFIQNMRSVLLQINGVARYVANSSEQVSIGSNTLSQGATEQAGAMEQLSAMIGEISRKVRRNSEHASSATINAADAGKLIEESNLQMCEMTQAMEHIRISSAQIEKIIKTIEDIALQSNILALNASVEAAHAGIAGKGFAIVAGEVRDLASKSSEAPKISSDLIHNSIELVSKETLLSSETAKSLEAVK